ncbi:uncharacterized protein LOC143299504 [Babylonia areolata]|uniref:uncharacterized protein LOC143299504 n=1 Tax=Babylonia areolata TaxID=304850 RepID=UPI003FD3BD4D
MVLRFHKLRSTPAPPPSPPTLFPNTDTTETWVFPKHATVITDSDDIITTMTSTMTPTEAAETVSETSSPSSTMMKMLTTRTTTLLKDTFINMTERSPGEEGVAVDVGLGGGRGGVGGGGGGGGGVPRVNTPLNAPQPSLEPVVTGGPPASPPSLIASYADLSDLVWIIPISVVCLIALVLLAMALYHGVRKLELRMLGWCYRNCPCCCAPGGGGGLGGGGIGGGGLLGRGGRVLRGEQYDTLSEEESAAGRRETVRLREFREGSASYGMTRKLPKEYSPKRDHSPSFDDGGGDG